MTKTHCGNIVRDRQLNRPADHQRVHGARALGDRPAQGRVLPGRGGG